jgi:hypothetical protein
MAQICFLVERINTFKHLIKCKLHVRVKAPTAFEFPKDRPMRNPLEVYTEAGYPEPAFSGP